MSTITDYLGSIFGLAALAYAGWRQVAWQLRVVRARPLGTLGRFTNPFQAQPGYRVIQVVSTGGSFIEDQFTVSVAAAASLRLKVKTSIPVGVRKEALQRLTTSVSEHVLAGYFTFDKAPKQPWPRSLAEEVAVALSCLGPAYGLGTLEARDGRLVYSWSRVQTTPQLNSQELSKLAIGQLDSLVTALDAHKPF